MEEDKDVAEVTCSGGFTVRPLVMTDEPEVRGGE